MKLKGIAFIYDFDIRTPLGHGDVGYLHCKFRSFLTGSKGKHNVSFPVVCRSNGKTAAHAHTGQPRVRTTKHTAVVQSLRNYKYTCQYPDVSFSSCFMEYHFVTYYEAIIFKPWFADRILPSLCVTVGRFLEHPKSPVCELRFHTICIKNISPFMTVGSRNS